jgi:hypothetical protein
MYDFLIGGKAAASRSLAVYLFDHNSLRRQPSPVRHLHSTDPCVVGAGSSSNRLSHSNLHSERKDFAWPQQ